jgi:hypothetical protein
MSVSVTRRQYFHHSRNLRDVDWYSGLGKTGSPPCEQTSTKPDGIVLGDDLQNDTQCQEHSEGEQVGLSTESVRDLERLC